MAITRQQKIAAGVTVGALALIAGVSTTLYVLSSNTWYVQNAGGTAQQCTGKSNQPYDGAGTGEGCAFKDLNDALTAATFGDTIVLKAGETFLTPAQFYPYVLTDKGAGTEYITITSSIAPPPDGTRVMLADRANMPKLVVQGDSEFFQVRKGAHHYRLSGLWFTNQLGKNARTLIGNHGYDLEHPDPRDPQTDWPHDIVIDHCWFNPAEWDAEPDANLYSSVNNASTIGGINITYRDNVIKGLGARYTDQVTALDGAVIQIGTSPGPMLIDNNFLEHWFVALFYGGGDPASMYGGTVASSPAPTLTSATLDNVNGLKVGDNIAFQMTVPAPYTGDTVAAGTVTAINGNAITFTHLVAPWGGDNAVPIPNGASLPLTPGKAIWNGYVPSNIVVTHNYFSKPTRWSALVGNDGKGMFEMKLCDTCLIDGNIFDGKTGWTVTVRNQGGWAPWSVIRNLTISNNLSVRFGAGLSSLFKDNQRLSVESSNIVITNNLMYGDTGPDPTYGQGPYFFSGSYGKGVTITHNTVLQSGEIMRSGNAPGDDGAINNLVFRDNIVNWGVYPQGFLCFSDVTSSRNPPTCAPNLIWTSNVMTGAPTGPLYAQASLADYPPGNWNPANISEIGFTDPATNNYRLLSSSPYYKKASDGSDVGVNTDQLLAHLNGPIPLPTPPSSPSPTVAPTVTPTPSTSPSPVPSPSASPIGVYVQGYIYANGVQYAAGDALVTITTGGVVVQQVYGRQGDGLFGFLNVAVGSMLTATAPNLSFERIVIGGPLDYYVIHGVSAAPSPTPTPHPSPTATPTPAGNICKPNQLQSTGCTCTTKWIGNPPKCKP